METILVIKSLVWEIDTSQYDSMNNLWKSIYKEWERLSPDRWIETIRSSWASIIMSDMVQWTKDDMCRAIEQLENIFLTIPFVALWELDRKLLQKNNVVVANSPWSNKYAVAERAVRAATSLMRSFSWIIPKPDNNPGIDWANILILGRWNIWSLVGNVFSSLWWNVSYFGRWDNLQQKAEWVDLIINCLASTESTKNILSETFFSSLVSPIYYINCVIPATHDIDAIHQALSDWRIIWFADDYAHEPPRDTNAPYYLKVTPFPRTICTPHIARDSEWANRRATQMCIENIRMRLQWTPQNVISSL